MMGEASPSPFPGSFCNSRSYPFPPIMYLATRIKNEEHDRVREIRAVNGIECGLKNIKTEADSGNWYAKAGKWKLIFINAMWHYQPPGYALYINGYTTFCEGLKSIYDLMQMFDLLWNP